MLNSNSNHNGEMGTMRFSNFPFTNYVLRISVSDNKIMAAHALKPPPPLTGGYTKPFKLLQSLSLLRSNVTFNNLIIWRIKLEEQ